MNLHIPSYKMQKHLRFLREHALRSLCHTSKHGCGILSGGRMTFFAINQPTRTVVDGIFIGCLHSEAACIRKCIRTEYRGKSKNYVVRKMKKKRLIIIRANMDNSHDRAYSLSAPCNDCLKCIRQSGLNKIIFSTNDSLSKIAKVNTNQYENKHLSWGRRNIQ